MIIIPIALNKEYNITYKMVIDGYLIQINIGD